IACSRAPEPTTRTRSSDGANEVVDRDRGQRLVLGGAPRAELERYPRDRLLVRGLDHVDEVEVAERRPLRLDRRAQLLDLPVDLLDAGRVVLDRLYSLGRERREHDVGRHGSLLCDGGPATSTRSEKDVPTASDGGGGLCLLQ